MPAQLHLTPDQIDHYQTHGYVLGPRVLSDDQITRFKQRIDDILHRRVDFPDHLMGQTTEKSDAAGQLPSLKIVNIFRHDPVFAEMTRSREVSSLAHDLMAAPVRIWEDQIIFKPPFDEDAVLGWHQDYTFWDHVGPPELGTCWIALDDATVDNGCMHVIPGSHRWPMTYTREDLDVNDPHWLMTQQGIPSDADLTPVPCPVKAGHCHFHHCRTFHGSYGNRSDNPRRSYIMHLMPGTTCRIGDNWNDRMGDTESVPVGQILAGPDYPQLPAI